MSCFRRFKATSPSLKLVPMIWCFLSQTPKTIQANSCSRKFASLLRAEKYFPNSSISKLVSAFLNSTTSFSECSQSLLNMSIYFSIATCFLIIFYVGYYCVFLSMFPTIIPININPKIIILIGIYQGNG